MEFQDLANVKHIKVIASTGIATVAVATGTSPALAHGATDNNSTKPSYSNSNTSDDKDCPPETKPVTTTPTPAPVTPLPSYTPTPIPTPKPVEAPATPAPMKALPAVATPDKPIDTASVAAVEQPTSLPKTGAEGVVAVGALATIGGYFANLFRLHRKQQ